MTELQRLEVTKMTGDDIMRLVAGVDAPKRIRQPRCRSGRSKHRNTLIQPSAPQSENINPLLFPRIDLYFFIPSSAVRHKEPPGEDGIPHTQTGEMYSPPSQSRGDSHV